ncbi:MAG: acyl carrier protein, partial [Planctomycetota bacterium]
MLKVKRVGVEDRFPDAGGDSILAARLLALTRERMGVEISMIDFFDAATVREQAALIEKLRPEAKVKARGTGGSLLAIQTGGGGIPFFCVPGA